MGDFAMGFLAAVFIIILIVAIAGTILGWKNQKRISSLENSLSLEFDNIYRSISEQDEHLKNEIMSKVDSRVNKLETKIEPFTK